MSGTEPRPGTPRRAHRDRAAIRRRGLLAALAVLVVTNAAVFAHVAWNRAGGPTARLALTDRELRLPDDYRYDLDDRDEDTGIRVWLEVQETGPDWLDREKLGELGFDVALDPDADGAEIRYRNLLPREVWAVLEHDGEAWRSWLEAREAEVEEVRREVERGDEGRDDLRSAEERLAEQRIEASRLFPVDAGLDRDALRQRYGDSGRYAVVPATVSLRRVVRRGEPGELEGSVTLLANDLTVPLRLRPPVERAIEERRRQWRAWRQRARPTGEWGAEPPQAPVLRAEVAFGRLGEPWLVSVERLAVEDRPAPDPASDSPSQPTVTEEDSGDGSGGD